MMLLKVQRHENYRAQRTHTHQHAHFEAIDIVMVPDCYHTAHNDRRLIQLV